MSQESQKISAAKRASQYIEDGMIVGVGTGSTVNHLITELKEKAHKIEGVVASSHSTLQRLKEINIPLLEPNVVTTIDLYIDGADAVNKHKQCIKGGGAALTGEKILTAMSKKFICIVDQGKVVELLGSFPLPIEVIPMARSYVAREMVKIGGNPMYRQGVITEYGNIILDVHNLEIIDPESLETQLNQMAGVVTNGIFSHKRADIVIVGKDDGIEILE